MHLPLVAFMALNLVFGHDWVHVPDLITHYQEHEQRDPSIGFFAFMAMHYGEAEHKEDDRTHEQLPFQNHHHGTGIDAGVSKAPGQETLRAVSFPGRTAERDFPLPDADALLRGHSAELLRPPKALA